MRMPPEQARHLFGTARVARLATADATGQPHVVPITFTIVDDTVVSAVDAKPKRTTALRRLANIAANPAVSLLVDHYDDADWSRLWWARADGTADVADHDPAGIAALIAKYPQYEHHPPAGPVVRVRVTAWRGWAASAPAHPG
ncbi:TIGR03668 family PPOX class F420-dependent oxidoreductase [Saccharomonospora saliphila]|uniref:TIGR03668 family PPOX class F420-dependent oxidoreductase n=1 Tax=Saccharomonospora saliphila TaxID=369829 RepID=UPI0003786879|nr:TIGR03668 family PPOX class F420-dependent oxidoreductase [Saccharomonospora saliphila]